MDDDKRGWGSWYATPIRIRGEIQGLLVLAARKHGVFDQHTTGTLRTLDPVLTGSVGSAIDYIKRSAEDSKPVHRSFRLTRM